MWLYLWPRDGRRSTLPTRRPTTRSCRSGPGFSGPGVGSSAQLQCRTVDCARVGSAPPTVSMLWCVTPDPRRLRVESRVRLKHPRRPWRPVRLARRVGLEPVRSGCLPALFVLPDQHHLPNSASAEVRRRRPVARQALSLVGRGGARQCPHLTAPEENRIPDIGSAGPDRARRSRLKALRLVHCELRRCVVRITDDYHRQRRGVQSRRGKPLGRARTSGGFASRANVNDRETARSCCEPSRRLDAVERRWSSPCNFPGRRWGGGAGAGDGCPSTHSWSAESAPKEVGHWPSRQRTGREDVHPPACSQASWTTEASGIPMQRFTHDPTGPARRRDAGLTWKQLPTRGRVIHPRENHSAVLFRRVRRLPRNTASRSTSWLTAHR